MISAAIATTAIGGIVGLTGGPSWRGGGPHPFGHRRGLGILSPVISYVALSGALGEVGLMTSGSMASFIVNVSWGLGVGFYLPLIGGVALLVSIAFHPRPSAVPITASGETGGAAPALRSRRAKSRHGVELAPPWHAQGWRIRAMSRAPAPAAGKDY